MSYSSKKVKIGQVLFFPVISNIFVLFFLFFYNNS